MNRYHHGQTPVSGNRLSEDTMPNDDEDLQIKEDLTRDLLSRLADPDEST